MASWCPRRALFSLEKRCEERVLWELMGKQEKNFDGSVTKEEAMSIG